mgnify:CR=1 FL=1
MGRKNSPSAKKELTEIIQRYEAAKAEKRQLYLDGSSLILPIGMPPNANSTMHRKSLITDFNCTPATLAY